MTKAKLRKHRKRVAACKTFEEYKKVQLKYIDELLARDTEIWVSIASKK